MNIRFFKYQGAGNDFILYDNRDHSINHRQPALIQQLCHRRFGIGADGVMFLQEKEGYDFEMVYYNSDGKPSSMCGNGGRCIVAFAKFLGLISSETNFLAVDGPHYATISEKGDWVSLQMIDVENIDEDSITEILIWIRWKRTARRCLRSGYRISSLCELCDGFKPKGCCRRRSGYQEQFALRR